MEARDKLEKLSYYLINFLIIVTPLTYWPTSKLIAFPFYDIGLGLLIVTFLWDLVQSKRFPKIGAFEIIALLLIIWFYINSSFWGHRQAAEPMIEMLILLFIMNNSKISLKHTVSMLYCLLVTGMVISAIAVYQYIIHTPIIASTLSNPNLLSGYLIILLPLSFSFWLSHKTSRRYFGIISTTALVFGMTLSFTRIGWLCAIGSMALFALLRKKRLLLVLILYILVFGNFIHGAAARFEDISQAKGVFAQIEQENLPSGSTLDVRLNLWKFALMKFSNKPITGIGLGNYREYLSEYIKLNPKFLEKVHAIYETHNSYIKILAETGIIGFSLFMALLILLIKSLVGNIRLLLNRYNALQIGIMCGILGYLLHNLTNNLLMAVPTSYVFWVSLGILNKLPKEEFDW